MASPLLLPIARRALPCERSGSACCAAGSRPSARSRCGPARRSARRSSSAATTRVPIYRRPRHRPRAAPGRASTSRSSRCTAATARTAASRACSSSSASRTPARACSASALAMNKVKAKELFRLHNLPTPALLRAARPSAERRRGARRVRLPGGGQAGAARARSVGVGDRARREHELEAAVEDALRFDDEVLVERFIDGQGDLGRGPRRPRARRGRDRARAGRSTTTRTSTRAARTEYHVPARLSPERYRGVLAQAAARAPGARLRRRDARRHDRQRARQRVHARGQHPPGPDADQPACPRSPHPPASTSATLCEEMLGAARLPRRGDRRASAASPQRPFAGPDRRAAPAPRDTDCSAIAADPSLLARPSRRGPSRRCRDADRGGVEPALSRRCLGAAGRDRRTPRSASSARCVCADVARRPTSSRPTRSRPPSALDEPARRAHRRRRDRRRSSPRVRGRRGGDCGLLRPPAPRSGARRRPGGSRRLRRIVVRDGEVDRRPRRARRACAPTASSSRPEEGGVRVVAGPAAALAPRAASRRRAAFAARRPRRRAARGAPGPRRARRRPRHRRPPPARRRSCSTTSSSCAAPRHRGSTATHRRPTDAVAVHARRRRPAPSPRRRSDLPLAPLAPALPRLARPRRRPRRRRARVALDGDAVDGRRRAGARATLARSTTPSLALGAGAARRRASTARPRLAIAPPRRGRRRRSASRSRWPRPSTSDVALGLGDERRGHRRAPRRPPARASTAPAPLAALPAPAARARSTASTSTARSPAAPRVGFDAARPDDTAARPRARRRLQRRPRRQRRPRVDRPRRALRPHAPRRRRRACSRRPTATSCRSRAARARRPPPSSPPRTRASTTTTASTPSSSARSFEVDLQRRPDRARRLDHLAAAREEPLPRSRAHAGAQAARGDPHLAARGAPRPRRASSSAT